MVSKHDLIFQQWVASLVNRDRTRNAIQGNFEDLFLSLKREGLNLETAYEFLGKAIKAHEPSASLIKNVYKKIKLKGAQISEKEFGESWCKDIAIKANGVFFDVFPVETKPEEPEDPVVYGSMTAKEYKAQRKHAEEYPRLDLEALEKRMHGEDYNPVADIAALMGQDSGNSN